jgi:hypothetical protein
MMLVIAIVSLVGFLLNVIEYLFIKGDGISEIIVACMVLSWWTISVPWAIVMLSVGGLFVLISWIVKIIDAI